MKKLGCYEQDARIDDKRSLKGRVYCLDGHPHERANECGLSVGVGWPSCVCCDCFFVEEEEIVFVEFKGMLKEKEDDSDYFDRFIKKAVKQMQGGMAVLGRFALCADDDDRKILNRKYYSLLVVLHGEDPINSRVLTNRSIVLYEQLRDYRPTRKDIRMKLGSLLKDTLKKVEIAFPARLEEKLKKALHPDQSSSAAA